jgi:hypothetical protein
MKAFFVEAKTKRLIRKKEEKFCEKKARKFTRGLKNKRKLVKRAKKKKCKRNVSLESSSDENEVVGDDSSKFCKL